MKYFILMLSTILLTACASFSGLQQKTHEELIVETANKEQTSKINFIMQPTHGQIADVLVIGLGGARPALDLREVFDKTEKAGGGVILYFSPSPALSVAILKGALRGDKSYPRVVLYYAGLSKHSAELKKRVESKNMKYEFIDLYKSK